MEMGLNEPGSLKNRPVDHERARLQNNTVARQNIQALKYRNPRENTE